MNGFHHFENGDRKLPDSLNVLPETSQVKHTKILNKTRPVLSFRTINREIKVSICLLF